MRNKLVYLGIVILVLSLITGCSTVTKMITGTVMKDYLEDPEDGPQKSIDTAFDDILANIALDDNFQNQDLSTASISDYNWSKETSRISASIGDPPGNTSGILTARDIRIEYSYSIKGEPKSDDLDTITKNGTLMFVIDTMVYDESKDKLDSMTTAFDRNEDLAPQIQIPSKITSDIISASVSNLNNPKFTAAIGGTNHPIIPDNDEINNDTEEITVNTGQLNSTEIGVLVGINRGVLADPDNTQTGFSIALFATN